MFLAKFLNLQWTDALAHHEDHIGSDISLSSLERSTDQVVQKLYTSGNTGIFKDLEAQYVYSTHSRTVKFFENFRKNTPKNTTKPGKYSRTVTHFL